MDTTNWLWILTLIMFTILPFLWRMSSRFRFYAKIIAYNLCLVIAAFISSAMNIPHGVTPKNNRRVFTSVQFLTGWVGMTRELRNGHYLKSDSPCIVVSNHQSSLDVLGISSFWPDNCVVMLKKSLLYLPGVNLTAYLTGAIFVDRFKRSEAIKSCMDTVKAIKERNLKVWIFPEGTRNDTGGFLPFKKGAFHIAMEAKIPIVPVVISSYKPFLDQKRHKFECGGRSIGEVLEPIDSRKFEDVDSLMAYTRETMLLVYPRVCKEAEELFLKDVRH